MKGGVPGACYLTYLGSPTSMLTGPKSKSWASFGFYVYAWSSIHWLCFIQGHKIYARKQGEISRQWKFTLNLFPWDVKLPEGLELAHTTKTNASTNDDEARNGKFPFPPSTLTLFTSVNRDNVNPSWSSPSAMLEWGMFSPCVYHYACTCFWTLSW